MHAAQPSVWHVSALVASAVAARVHTTGTVLKRAEFALVVVASRQWLLSYPWTQSQWRRTSWGVEWGLLMTWDSLQHEPHGSVDFWKCTPPAARFLLRYHLSPSPSLPLHWRVGFLRFLPRWPWPEECEVARGDLLESYGYPTVWEA